MPTRPIHSVIDANSYLIVNASTPVREVVCKMASSRLSAALVSENGLLAGIFTERDATFRVLAPGLDADTTAVSTVMTANPQCIAADRPFGHALHMMYEGGFRHVPVIDADKKPIGMVSSADALSLEAIQFSKELVQREDIDVIL